PSWPTRAPGRGRTCPVSSGGLERRGERGPGEGEAELEQFVDRGFGLLARGDDLAARTEVEARTGHVQLRVRGDDAPVDLGQISAVGHGELLRQGGAGPWFDRHLVASPLPAREELTPRPRPDRRPATVPRTP